MTSLSLFILTLYRAAMWLGGLWCHQRPERSPHAWAVQVPLCWRCSGIIAGAGVLALWLLTRKRVPPFALSIALALLLPLDVLYNVVSGGPGDNARRFMTGLLWGIFGTGAALHLMRFAAARVSRRSEARRLMTNGVARI